MFGARAASPGPVWRLTGPTTRLPRLHGAPLHARMPGKLATSSDQIAHLGHPSRLFRAYFKHAFPEAVRKGSQTFCAMELCSNNLTDFGLKKGMDKSRAVRRPSKTSKSHHQPASLLTKASGSRSASGLPAFGRRMDCAPTTIGSVFRYSPGIQIHEKGTGVISAPRGVWFALAALTSAAGPGRKIHQSVRTDLRSLRRSLWFLEPTAAYDRAKRASKKGSRLLENATDPATLTASTQRGCSSRVGLFLSSNKRLCGTTLPNSRSTNRPDPQTSAQTTGRNPRKPPYHREDPKAIQNIVDLLGRPRD